MKSAQEVIHGMVTVGDCPSLSVRHYALLSRVHREKCAQSAEWETVYIWDKCLCFFLLLQILQTTNLISSRYILAKQTARNSLSAR